MNAFLSYMLNVQPQDRISSSGEFDFDWSYFAKGFWASMAIIAIVCFLVS